MSSVAAASESRTTALELPEEIDLQVEPANVGSRTLAILIDLSLGGLVVFVIYAVALLLAHNELDDWLTWISTNALRVILFLVIFGFQWGYFSFFEWRWNGQTPGKRMLRLRVIKADGSPVSGVDVLLRNLARPIDTLGPMGLIGLVLIFVSRRAQRLGDLMAQTLVIHETKIDWSLFDSQPDTSAAARRPAPPIRLTALQWELLHRFVHRRAQFEAEARMRLAQRLHERLLPVAQGTDLARSALPPEEWLVELARRT